MKKGTVFEPLIEFSDFMPTMLEAAGIKYNPSDFDGKSFLSVIKGDPRKTRETAFVHYDPQWGKTGENRNRFAQTIQYKLYRDNRFFNIIADPLEIHPLASLTAEEESVRAELQKILDKAEKESPWVKERAVNPNQKE
jgi:arylsulfatase A